MQPGYDSKLTAGWSALEKRMLPAYVWESDSLTFWRERILFIACFLAVVLAPFVLVPSLWISCRESLWSIVVLDLVAYAGLVAIFTGRNWSLTVRTGGMCLILYALGAGVLTVLGPVGAGYIWLFGASVLISAMIGFRAAVWTLVINVLTLFSIAVCLALGMIDWSLPQDNLLEKWLLMSGNFLLVSLSVSLTTAMMLEGLSKALLAEQDTSRSLQESEERFRAVSETSHHAICIIDEASRITWVNRKFLEISGYTREQVLGADSFLAFLAPESVEFVTGNYRRFLSGEEYAHHYQFRIMRADGEQRLIEKYMTDYVDKHGRKHLIVSMLDVTDKMRMERALRESEEKFRLAFRTSPDAINFNRLSDGRYLEANEGFLKIMGYAPEEVIGKTSRELEIWEDPRDRERLVAMLRREGVVENWEARFRDKAGRTRVGLMSARVLQMKGEEVILSITRDITERQKLAERIAESEQQFRSIFEFSPQAISLADMEKGCFVDVNQKFCELIQHGREEVTGRTGMELGLCPGETLGRLERELKARGAVSGRRLDLTAKDGTPLQVQIYASLLTLAGRSYVLSMYVDITEQMRLERKLRQAQKMEAIGTLSGGIAHDFNNILTSVLGFAELALEFTEKGSPLQRYLQGIFQAGIRARDLVGQILTFSRKSEKELRPLQVDLITKEVLQLLKSTTPSNIRIVNRVASKSLVLGDAVQVHQVLMNLCTNAIHAMEDAGGTLTVSLTDEELAPPFVAAHPDLKPGAHVKLSVTDTGTGMPSHVLQQIFDPFFTTKKPGEGTGMGLSVVHGIVKSCGGEILVESEPGRGSTFTLYLPVLPHDSVVEEEPSAPLPGGSEHILFVDDEPQIAALVEETLYRLGYRVTIRTSSLEALELFRHRSRDFDLVISDMTMPHLTGDRLTGELLRIRPDIPVILCTGFSKRVTEDTVAAFGARALLMKPLVKSDLAGMIRQVLDPH